MPTRAEVQHRTSGPGLLGWLEREIAALPGLRVVEAGPIMRCEEYREPGWHVVRAELPGLHPDRDVEVTVDGTLLRIRAHRLQEHPECRRSEFFYGEMVRTISLPAGADGCEAVATYADGVLEVRVPLRDAPSAVTTVAVTRVG